MIGPQGDRRGKKMTAHYLRRDAVVVPLKTLLGAALEHQALFETGVLKLEALTLPCAPAQHRPEPLRSYRPAVLDRLLDAGDEGYASLIAPLARLFAKIPPVLNNEPLRVSVSFSRWKECADPQVLIPVEIGGLDVSVGGARFSGVSPGAVARQMAHYLAEHEGMEMEDDLHPWTFDVPELAEHVAPFQGLMADTAPNAVSRLGALSPVVREYIRDGGSISAVRADDEDPTEKQDPTSGRKQPPRGTALRS